MHARAVVIAVLLAAVLALPACDDDSAMMDDTNPRPAPIDGSIVIPPAWTGQWQVVVTFSDCGTGDVIAVEDVVGTLCESDTLSLDITPLLGQCEGLIDDERFDAACEHVYFAGECEVRVSMLVNVDRDGDEVTGSGVWTAETSGPCSLDHPAGCERFVIEATRLDRDPGPCGAGAAPLADAIAGRARLFLRGMR